MKKTFPVATGLTDKPQNRGLCRKEDMMRRLIAAMVLLVACFVGMAFAQDLNEVWTFNFSTSDTWDMGSPVGLDTSAITVVTKVALGTGVDTLTVADSLKDGTLPTDYNEKAKWYINVRTYQKNAGPDTDSTRTLTLSYRTPFRLETWELEWTAEVDTFIMVRDNRLAVCKFLSVTAERYEAGDSVAVYAYPAMPGAVTGTGIGSLTSATPYYGQVVSEQVLPRTAGLVAISGIAPAKLRTAANAGVLAVPSGTTAGMIDDVAALTADYEGWVAGRILQYGKADDVVDMVVSPFAIGAVGSTIDSAVTLIAAASTADSAYTDSIVNLASTADSAYTDSIVNLASTADSAYTLGLVESIWEYQVGAGMFALSNTNPPSLAQVVGTNFEYDGLAFDSTADESAYVNLVVPSLASLYPGATLNIDIWWVTAAAATDSVGWAVELLNVADGEDFDDALATTGSVMSVNAGAGKLNVATIAITGLTFAADDIVPVLLYRDVGVAENLANDAVLLRARFRF